jgi:hypothetical protein
VVWVVVVDVCEFPLVCELLADGVVAAWPVLPVETVLLGDVLWATTQVAHSRRADNNVVRNFIMQSLRGLRFPIELTASVSNFDRVA